MAFHISDTHFGHENVIKYCNRPFSSVREMNESIIAQWNSVISKKDIVYHHGDFALRMSKEEVYDIVRRLNGRIILIYGNHDRKGVGWFMDCGFYKVYRKGFILNDKYLLSHAPKDLDKYPRHIVNIHGHIHNHGLDSHLFPRHINVSCEVVDYKPVWID